ncbi:VPLPA-CTERM sorting domain-containing protein [Oceanicoccus sagamiensis]|uniref:PEP-CTERM protein-sorting domain-containing protein n=1 Tax=Oceanicoccus sagamiensis TaxID=716816 RepID=A0A1X9N347_9GAMM|nr:VPLPA-CTERM sorting domain-containing protein [Oceanicoccus sagamiensis]ARN72638.1 hypothetical protein BST96_00025 [Oceanicoccus sagamiensis]ARN76232.1 hypothetical protein BST96_20265 [Oceanicoccus sagamiensis]
MLKQTLAIIGLTISLSANAALYDRGNGMIYDDTLDITWLQDANYAQTSGYDADGRMTWDDANAWADQLNYGGFDDWRLASANLINGASPCFAYDGSCDRGYNITTGELGHMFYNNLGNLGAYDASGSSQSGFGVSNSSFTDGDSGDNVSILNLQNNVYWYGEEHAPSTVNAWIFGTGGGQQYTAGKSTNIYSWAVRAGDVSSVPVPAAAWLFGTALLGLVGVKRKK